LQGGGRRFDPGTLHCRKKSGAFGALNVSRRPAHTVGDVGAGKADIISTKVCAAIRGTEFPGPPTLIT
jgi:hypothetical protein